RALRPDTQHFRPGAPCARRVGTDDTSREPHVLQPGPRGPGAAPRPPRRAAPAAERPVGAAPRGPEPRAAARVRVPAAAAELLPLDAPVEPRSEEHTSELQSRENLVCR